jgi:hypothetical protein
MKARLSSTSVPHPTRCTNKSHHVPVPGAESIIRAHMDRPGFDPRTNGAKDAAGIGKSLMLVE